MSRTTSMIRRLALLEHVLFVALVVVGVTRGIGSGDHAVALVSSSALLCTWYAVGARPLPVLRQPVMGRGGRWLVVLVACWLVTVVVSPDMVWVAFALWLLAGHLLALGPCVALSAAVLVVVIGRGGHAEDWSTAAVVGPLIGGVFAVALSRGLQVIVRDGVERERLVASLVTAQQEAEDLHAELAGTQREAGVLAERSRLSRDIHDGLAQGFSSILLLARAAVASREHEARARLLAQIETSAAEHLEEARRVVGALAPAPLESGLVEALRRIVTRVREETGVAGEVRLEGDVTALPPFLEVALLRVAQSALANVRRHAQATQVVVTIAEAESVVRLDVVDDGAGFDTTILSRPEQEVSRGGYGLRASRERLREVGGELDVESAPGVGTALSAHVPLGTGVLR